MIKLIKTEEEYKAALAKMEELFQLKPEDENFSEAELLMRLISIYEKENFLIETADPISAIKFRMEQLGLKKVNMVSYFGSRGRVSEVLNKKRALTLSMIRKLHNELKIPAECLIREYDLE